MLTNRNIIILLIIFAMSMSALAEINSPDNSPAGTPIKVMSYNIFYDKYKGVPNATDSNAWNYTSGTSRKERVINMIMSETEAFGNAGPDILGVQETVQNQADDMQKAMTGYGLSGVCGKTGCEACRIFYRSDRFTKIDSGTFWLSETPDVQGSVCAGAKYPRIASWVILKDLKNQKSCFVLNTHWDFSQEPKCYSAKLIRDKITALSGGLPMIMMGDLNTRENERAYSILVGNEEPNGMRLTDTHRSIHSKSGDDEATFHGWRGGASGNRIDYIFHNDGFYTESTTVERNKVLNNYPSDHYPITATIYYKDSAASASASIVAHWDFNGASGTTVTESVGGLNATILGGAALNGSGKVYLDGTDDYVSMPVGAVISDLNSFTITAKINFSGTGSAWQRIFSFNNSTSEFMNLAFTSTADNEVLFKCRHDSHDEVVYGTSKFVLTGEHYFAVSIDSTNKIARVYIDGQVVGQSRWAEFKPSDLGATANNWLGKSEYSTGALFRGYIDDFRIYNNVLTPAQLSAIAGYNGAVEPIPADNTMGTDRSVTLSWSATSGTSFDVYFGNNLSSVTNATNSLPVGAVYKGRVTQKTFAVTDLNPQTTYYWRIDEIDNGGNPVKGKVWQFTTIPDGTPVKVMCFNIKGDYGIPSLTDPDAWDYALGTDRRERVINMVLSESEAFGSSGPDIIGMQEPKNNQVSDLKSALTGYGFYGVDVDGSTSGGKAGIFYRASRFTKLNSGTFWLSYTPNTAGSKHPDAAEARIASWVILSDSLTGQSYFVLNTHWDHVSKEANYYSAGLVRDKIAELSGGRPVIMMGDLNTQETEAAFLRLIGNEDPTGTQFTDTFRALYQNKKDDEVTCHGWNGGTYGSRIDFILHNDEFTTGRAGIERNKMPDGRYPSDHYPITATLYYQQYLPTDLNTDGAINFKDLALFAGDWLESGYYTDSDQIGLVAHWDFEGAAGTTTVPDLVGNNNATIVGTSLDGSGGVTFAGGTVAQYVDLGAGVGSIINNLMDSTIIVDFAWDGSAAGTYQKIWSFSQAGTTQFGTLTFVSSNEQYIRYQHRYSAHDENTNAETPLLTGRHQIVIANNAAYGSYGSVQLYLDGVQEAFHTQTVRADLALLGATTRNYLGKSPYDAGNYFDGTIYDFRIYNRCLSAQEIADIYNGTVGQTYVSLDSASNFYDDEIVNFLDFAIFAESWLESQ